MMHKVMRVLVICACVAGISLIACSRAACESGDPVFDVLCDHNEITRYDVLLELELSRASSWYVCSQEQVFCSALISFLARYEKSPPAVLLVSA